MNFTKVCVLGLGYIGLPTASMLATHGLKVIGIDIDRVIVSKLQSGEVHVQEPGLKTLVEDALGSGSLQVSQQVQPADAFIIAVPTPFYDDKTADMRAVTSAAESIVPHLQAGNLVILESTSPPLTTVNLVAPILERSGLQAGKDFFLAYSPERVLPGQIIRELVENARVIGGFDPRSSEAAQALYSFFVNGEIILTDATTAEMVKLMENTYRDINIAIANEFFRLATRYGVDIWQAIAIANHHPRVKILKPGPGVGGHCISVDPWFLVEAAPDLSPLIRTARQVNDSQPQFVADLVAKKVGALSGKRVALLGLSFKPEVDDLRESPAIDIAYLLKKAGALVQAYEPFKPAAALPGLTVLPTLDAALSGADAVLLLVAHTQLCNLDPQAVRQATSARLVIDAVNGWNPAAWKAAGFEYYRLGSGE